MPETEGEEGAVVGPPAEEAGGKAVDEDDAVAAADAAEGRGSEGERGAAEGGAVPEVEGAVEGGVSSVRRLARFALALSSLRLTKSNTFGTAPF